MGIQGYFCKTEALHVELNERAEAATSVVLQQVIFYNIFAVSNHHQEIQFRCLVHEFSFTDVF